MPKKVLVVDDSFMMRTIMRDIVSSDAQLEVVGEAKNGIEALDLIKKLDPDVVLLDIEMPEMDGLECFKRLRLISKARVIIVSSVAQSGSPQAQEAQRLGAFAIVPKPSGAMSLDLTDKKGHEITSAIRKAVGL
jgi:two-component system chemotaxis response regulator CheB